MLDMFQLQAVEDGTRLTVTESGFDQLPPTPAARRPSPPKLTTGSGSAGSSKFILPDNSAQLGAAPLFAARLFAALGDETRLRLLMLLGNNGPSSITGLTKGGVLTRRAVTKHLGVLQKAGLVAVSRLGRESVWHLERQCLAETQAWLDTRSRDWDSRIDRLRALVEEHLQSSDDVR